MPRGEQLKPYTTFVKGMITEAGPLTFPENATSDESNFILYRDGRRKRRLGVDYEGGYQLSTSSFSDAALANDSISTSVWSAVGGDGNRNFLVTKIGATLYFHDLGESVLSTSLKSFTVSLVDFKVAGVANLATTTVSTSSGRGLLFVVGSKIEPFYVEYDPDTDTITTNQISIKIRDFEGVDDGLAVDEEPSTLSTEHEYNLRNQGWNSPGEGVAEPITTYHSSKSVYPPNSKQWWVGKDSNEDFSAPLLAKFSQGAMLAPRGHFLLDPFNKDRNAASGLTGLTTESVDTRPVSTAFYAGRVWYAGVVGKNLNSEVFYSQVVDDNSKIGRCYQDADPTSEDISDQIDTDGGVISVPGVGNIIRLFETEDKLILFADNGTWAVSGTDGGFKATDFSVDKIGPVGIIGPESVLDLEGTPVWWADTGIYTIQGDQITGKLKPVNLSANTIQTFYNDIPALAKAYCKGVYDAANRRAQWFYPDNGFGLGTTSTELKKYTKVITFDLDLQAFYPWEIKLLDTNSPYIGSVFKSPVLSVGTEDIDIIDGVNDVFDGVNDVQSTQAIVKSGVTFLGLFTFEPQGDGTSKYTFAEFNNEDYLDWEKADTIGVDAAAYMDTGYETNGDIARFKQALYLLLYFDKTANGGCLVKAKWDWHDDPNLGKHSTKFQGYRERSVQQGPVVITRSKIRGKGRALQLRYESQPGKDLEILGWAIPHTGNTKL